MIGLASLEVCNFIFNVTEENNRFELYKFPDSKGGGILYDKVRDEIENDLEISNITANVSQDEKIGPISNKEYRKEVSKRIKNDMYGCFRIFYYVYISRFRKLSRNRN